MTQLALVLRCLHAENVANISLIYTNENAQEVLIEMKYYQDKLLKDYNSWSYCPSSKIIKEPIVPYWVLEKSPVMKYENLYEVIELIIENSESMTTKLKNKENYSREMFMIFFNCLGNSLKYTLKAIDDLIDCELDRVKKLSNQKIFLLLGGVGIVGISICILALYLITIDKHLNSLWQFLNKRMRKGFLQIRQLIAERLSQYHGIYEIPDSEIDNSTLKKDEILKFKHSLWYLIRFSLIFLFAIGFYIILVLVYYDVICKLLEIRPQMVSGLALRRIQMTQISIFTLENEASFYGLSIYQTYPFFQSMKPAAREVIDLINSLKESSNAIKNPESKILMSEKLKSMIIEKISGVSTFLSMGSYRGVNFCIQESLFMIFNRSRETLISIIDYLNEIAEFSNITNILSMLSDSDSKMFIEEWMNNMIFFTVLCLTSLIACFFMFYYPLIAKEITILKKLTKLLVILPSSENYKQKEDTKSLTLVNSS
ncbi:hypothetical protein SteCoe_10923 [Stentor coeruleus]|uniref:Uncharacterized protein n=1 Tax=Stentor coeruleus TaxID=5963 RepID=A0A1R2CEF4_9CILI|nr:hypothetical protein SteCoe_10923 [Stentor coeruleus]